MVEVECMDELRPVGKALLKAIFVIAYFGAFRISECLISDDELKWLTLANASFLKSGTMRFVLYKTKNNSAGPYQKVLFPPIPGDVLCPVTAVHEYLELRPNTTLALSLLFSWTSMDCRWKPGFSTRFTLIFDPNVDSKCGVVHKQIL